jgi:cyclophilin family peptidyl-prolyl cis-trans isomerase/HEAT repeat protein
MRIFIFALSMCLGFLALVPVGIFSQPSTKAIDQANLSILKAEDARRYDGVLEGLLKNPNEQIRKRAVLAAGRIGNEAAVPTLSNLLGSDPSPSVRDMAAFALGEIESIRAADAILRLIGETAKASIPGIPEHNARGRLAEAAGKISAANVSDPKAKDLGQAIIFTLQAEQLKGGNRDLGTIRLALTAALRARPAGADETVRKFLADTDPVIIADALNTLARLRAKNANRDARDLLETHVHAIVRANAARVLGAAEDKEAVDLLIKAATSDADSRVRVSAVRALATLRDPKAAEPLLIRGETLLATYRSTRKPDFISAEQNEFIEIATALGRVLTNTHNERAVNLFREFGKLDRGFSPEAYIARVRIAPGRGDNNGPELKHWRQYSTLAQVVGEFATLDPTNEEGKRIKAEAPDVLRPLAKAYAEADPVKDADTIKAAPDVLRAYAAFKTADLAEIMRSALTNKDLFIRATAAEILGEQPVSQDNLDALNSALDYAIVNDAKYNDAVLATIDALFKLDKRKSLSALALASGSLDHLVRAKVLELLKDEAFKNVDSLPAMLRHAGANHLREVRPYSGKPSKLGQILNTDVDYRRALARKNGRVRAILTTQKGPFTIELLPEDAPLTVDNFIKLARSGYFNGLEVHRVVPNFVMQDGDPRGDGNGGPGWSIRCEINMVPYERGAVGMALSGKDTGGSQWFVTHSPQPHLDGGYTVFGRVNETGMKVVDKIVRGDKIVSVRIVEGLMSNRSGTSQNRER